MSSGRDVWMESWTQDDIKRQTKNLDVPYEVVYYLRVRGDKLTWGHMKQIDDDLKITYNTSKKSFTVEYL